MHMKLQTFLAIPVDFMWKFWKEINLKSGEFFDKPK